MRGVHHFGAQAMVLLLAAHLGQTAIFGAYRRPREVNWYLGLGLLLVTLAFALTGYLLPWDQKGYWATRVATGILGGVPLVGRALEELAVGGPAYGHLTLTRFYALHVGVLPAAALLLLAAHLALFRRHGVTPPVAADVTQVEPFYPRQAARDVAVALGVLVAIFAIAIRLHGAPLDAPADPASDYPARPEWYFLPLFELLKHLPGKLEPVGAVGLPLLAFGYLVVLPLVDTGDDRRLRDRAGLLAPLAAMAVCALLLGFLAALADADDPAYARARAVADARAARAAELFLRGVPPEGPLAMMKRDPETRGPELFAERCASCHRIGDIIGGEGKNAGPDLTGFGTRAWVLGVLDDPDAAPLFGHTPFKGMMPSMARPPEDPEAAKVWAPSSPPIVTRSRRSWKPRREGKAAAVCRARRWCGAAVRAATGSTARRTTRAPSRRSFVDGRAPAGSRRRSRIPAAARRTPRARPRRRSPGTCPASGRSCPRRTERCSLPGSPRGRADRERDTAVLNQDRPQASRRPSWIS